MKSRAALLPVSVLVAAIGVGIGMAAAPGLTLVINGQKSTTPALSQDGETWVPVSALRAAGAEVTVSGTRVAVQFTPVRGRVQSDLVEGVAGEWVNNGAWRIKVGEVKEAPSPFVATKSGYEVEVEFRNLATRAVSLHASGLDTIQLVDSENNQLALGSGSFPARYQSIPPGGAVTNRLRFGVSGSSPAQLGKADKLLVTFRPFGGKPARGFHVKLGSGDGA